ncbi:toxin-antitoxin system YwqK family antitoxin [Zunongwangia endophytica]|uniref:Toxin-antitoxin system YwqK family antitoxin n=1 Tax=Zunongwangia endophytica TaxID=1808945 RepID=A0ABV8H9W5_9FLAO|nr:aspartic peptidase [Zunongwangia endophytica]MDN3594775.1 aspartic peptidase [Zunongwangia endophytica]
MIASLNLKNTIISKAAVATILLLLFQNLSAQEGPNQKDAQGKRDGLWKVDFPGTNQTKFEGTFDHGKETGKFKFYKEGYDQHPSAIMDFETGSDSVAVKYYTQKGEVISEGMMLNKKRTGKWTIYHHKSDQIMMTEFYKDGKLDGLQTTYFKNGKIGEKTNYSNDIKDGSSQIYADNGQLLQDLNYKNGELDGHQTYYNPAGEWVAEGDYDNGRRIEDQN